MFTPEDLALLKQKGISEKQIEEQLHCFETGFPYLKLEAPAGLGNGILALDDTAIDHYLDIWDEYFGIESDDCEICSGIGCGQPYVQKFI